MKKIIKKLMAMTLTMALTAGCALAFSSSLTVHAATIGQISADKPGYGMVNVSEAELYNTDTTLIGTSLSYGTEIMVIGEYNDFYRVMYGTRTVEERLIRKQDLYLENEDYYLVSNVQGGLNMYVNTSTQSEDIATIPYRKSFAFASDAYGDWYRGVYGTAVGFTLKSETVIRSFN